MQKNIISIVTFILFTISINAQDPNFHIYLCFGQSNMEGSATIEDTDKVGHPRFKVMRALDCTDLNTQKNQWDIAIPPLSQCWSGLSPADYFGRTMIENSADSITIGIMNVAIGGCDIRLFDKTIYHNYLDTYPEQWFQDKIKFYNGNPYQRLIEMAALAQQDGVIKGILLHQGETNNGDKEWPNYVASVYNNILIDLKLEANKTPLLVGEVAHADQGGVCADMNTIIDQLPQTIPTAHIIPSDGCEVRQDSVHFNSAGVRELGKRYALKMLAIQEKEKTFTSTEIIDGDRVAFRLHAPKATEIKLVADGKWDKVEFKKDNSGLWEGFWYNVKPGAYSYYFTVDGVEVNDPKAANNDENTSILIVGEDEVFVMKDNVKHGAVSQLHYYSNTLNTTRRLHLWTPSGFEKSKKKLPVLYLIHGGGGSDASWTNIGCAANILDNLMAQGKIKPMLVVMPNGTIETENILDRVPLFKEDLINDIIPFVENNYRVSPKAKDRAIIGLSMGGLETLETVIYHPETFQYIGILSSGWWLSDSWAKKRGIIDNKEDRLQQLSKIAASMNKSSKMLHFTQGGKEDLAYENGMETLKLFNEAGIKYEYSESPGGHTWMVWRKNLTEIAPQLFK